MLIHLSGKNVNVTEKKILISTNCTQNLDFLGILPIFLISSGQILYACKVEDDNTQTLVDARDRGGLWKINRPKVKEQMLAILSIIPQSLWN